MNSPTDKLSNHLQTRIVHPQQTPVAAWQSLSAPVMRASTVAFPSLAALRAHDWRDGRETNYGIHGTPTSAALSVQLAEIEGGQHALLQPSGLASIVNVYLALLKQGDDVLVPDNVYGPSREHGDWLAQNFGISTRYYDPLIGADIVHLVQPNTRLIWIETPGSITMEVPDVPAITQVARAHGIYTALDNTWSAGLAFKPFDHGADIVVQALTKYQSGGSDILMGVTICNDSALYLKLKRTRMYLGSNVSVDDCSLILRSLPSLAIRYKAHGDSALALAKWFKTRPEVTAVLHPALPDCPGQSHWQRDFCGSGGLFSVVFNETFKQAQIDAFIEGLQFFKLGLSWGGSHSLALPFDVAPLRTATRWPHRGMLVRFYAGLEALTDLQADLERSMAAHLTH
jgi:cysteine-S-conjugate beta-lyase